MVHEFRGTNFWDTLYSSVNAPAKMSPRLLAIRLFRNEKGNWFKLTFAKTSGSFIKLIVLHVTSRRPYYGGWADLATERERQFTTGKRAERTKHAFR